MDENEKVGIDDILVVVDFVCDLASDVKATLADGKVTVSDAPRFFDNLFGIAKVGKALPQVDDQFLDLDPEEQEIINARVAEKLDFPEGAPKEVVKATIAVIVKSSSMIKAILNLVAVIKAAKNEV